MGTVGLPLAGILDWLFACLPLIVVLVLMLRFQWGGAQAGMAGWVCAQVVATARFGAGLPVLFYAQAKGLLLTLYVLYIIWGALAFFRVTEAAGVVRAVGAGLPRLTPDRSFQVLLLGWIFVAFLQGVGGYGVPIAVTAPLFVTLGFSPALAVVIPSVGHAWSVSFGSLGASFYALVASTGRTAAELAPAASVFSGIMCLVCGLLVLLAAGGRSYVQRRWLTVLLLGVVMAATQYAVLTHGLSTLGSMLAALSGLAVAVLWTTFRRSKTAAATAAPAEAQDSCQKDRVPSPLPGQTLPIQWALLPYALLIAIVLVVSLSEPVGAFLGQVVVKAHFPELSTASGWVTKAETGRTIDVFGHAGAQLFYAAVLTYGLFRLRGFLRPGSIKKIAHAVVKGAWMSSLGIAAMVGMASTMEHAGMTNLLADGIAGVAGRAFPLVSPFIGVLGAFMTGSNTNSNVIFANLQQQVAALIGVNPLIILAAQTTGGAVGSTFAPAKIIVACSTVNLGGKESEALGNTMRYGLAVAAVLAIAATVGVYVLAR
jgi:lactate permease